MLNKTITKSEADQLLRRKTDTTLERAMTHIPRNYSGDVYCLPTGAKLKVVRAKTKQARYYVGGYHYDGSDVTRLFDEEPLLTPSGVPIKMANRRAARNVWLGLRERYPENELNVALTDALTDIRHLCDRAGLDFADLDRNAYRHYSAEIHGEF